MGSWLSEREQRLVAGAETASAATPIPTQIVSNGEYLPPPQSETQKRVERRIFELADDNGKRLGLSRRQFMQTGCGMAAAFLAMNEVYGSARVPGRGRRGARARADAGTRAESCRAVHLRCADPFRARRLQPTRGSCGLAKFAGEHWNPKLKETAPSLVAVQIPELRQGGLLRQRHQPGAVERRAVRRSELVVLVERADRQDARDDQRLRGLAPPARAHHHHAQATRLDGGGRQGDRGLQAGSRGSPTPSATRARRRNIRGAWTTSR